MCSPSELSVPAARAQLPAWGPGQARISRGAGGAQGGRALAAGWRWLQLCSPEDSAPHPWRGSGEGVVGAETLRIVLRDAQVGGQRIWKRFLDSKSFRGDPRPGKSGGPSECGGWVLLFALLSLRFTWLKLAWQHPIHTVACRKTGERASSSFSDDVIQKLSRWAQLTSRGPERPLMVSSLHSHHRRGAPVWVARVPDQNSPGVQREGEN